MQLMFEITSVNQSEPWQQSQHRATERVYFRPSCLSHLTEAEEGETPASETKNNYNK